MSTAYVLVRDGFADWEAASAIAELRRTFGLSVRSIGLTTKPITSMGGLKVIPDLELADFRAATAAILIVPGGETWTDGEVPVVSETLRATIGLGRPVAAICAATLALAHSGLLDDCSHTSNGRGFIERYVPDYHGQKFYRSAPAVRQGQIITANGLAPFAFAAEIFRALAPDREPDIQTYEKLYASGMLD